MIQSPQSGFTLLETIVAFLVFALVAGALQLCLTGGWRAVGIARYEQGALQVAQARLAEAGVNQPLVEGVEEGVSGDGFAWTRDVRAHAGTRAAVGSDAVPVGYWVSVRVSWREAGHRPERSVSLTTLKLGSAK